jgi:lipopolysaccharide export system permease protein
MKKLDWYLIKGFIPPFILTFFIALFVLVMQFLWLYIDEIMGKGIDIFTMTELIFYLSIKLFPMALPIGVLISSVMVMGNLSERFELSSFKSAGIPLVRVMLSLMFFTFAIALFSVYCSNILIPVSNLKFQSRLYDIRRQKPALSLEEKIFNYDFQGFTIRIGQKMKDGKTIKDVLIYDNSDRSTVTGKFNMISAKSGEMYATEDKQYMIMELYDGHQYQEMSGTDDRGRYPFIRTEFKQWSKVFDLGEFNMDKTDENLFKYYHQMQTTPQLISSIDSIKGRINSKYQEIPRRMEQNYTLLSKKNQLKKPVTSIAPDTSGRNKTAPPSVDSIKASKLDSLSKLATRSYLYVSKPDSIAGYFSAVPKQDLSKPLASYKTFASTFPPDKRKELSKKAATTAKSVGDIGDATLRNLKSTQESLAKHIFELHVKFSLGLICFIFLFIGAPMGAIIRKGGFGYPILIAISFFLVFWVLNITFKNMAETLAMNAIVAAWLPCGIMLPLGLWLTYKAMHDSKIISFDVMKDKITALIKRK